ncbi:TIGR01841 family phasin [Paraburkholderia sp. J76]|uniref:TIGR01841 family phasin n=1 Tax=Paraburkholderia sp. J76 TaxID=2805439 RepID=UPI002ABDEF9F|nr:TIGR01841 family phasin [Paraburkholderia sp. J76]
MTESTIALPYSASAKDPLQTFRLPAETSDLMQIYLGAAQRITELNSRAIDATLDEQRAVALETAGERSPFDAWRLQASFALAGTAKAAAYWGHVNEILVDALIATVREAEGCLNRSVTALGDTANKTGSIILTDDTQTNRDDQPLPDTWTTPPT